MFNLSTQLILRCLLAFTLFLVHGGGKNDSADGRGL